MRLGAEFVEVDVGLRAAVVVGVACGGVVLAHAPLVEVGPLPRVVVVAVVGVDGVEGHESFVVDGAGPDVRFVDLLARVVGHDGRRVGIFAHEVAVGAHQGGEGLLAGGEFLGPGCRQHGREEQQSE